MAYIKETKRNETSELTIEVLEWEKHEDREPWKFISIDNGPSLTPKELRILGRWFINEGKRIGKEYKSNGKLRTEI